MQTSPSDTMTSAVSTGQPAQIDVAVLLLFFNRPDTLEKVFVEVKKARPTRLFLYQDGPRNEQDMPGIMQCREIVGQIDWQCQVEYMYQEKNYGCDPSEYIAQQWAFSKVDKCIVLEDDDVPSQSFFSFCKEMLDKYEDDQRVTLISGFNIMERCPDVPYDYFFTSVFSIWGWASWSRVVLQWDEHYRFLDDPFRTKLLSDNIRKKGQRADLMRTCRRHRQSGKAYYETIFWTYMLFNNGLAITPTVNLINNIGVSEDSTHFSPWKTTPSGVRKIFSGKRFELTQPLRHPTDVIEYTDYKDRYYRMQAWGHPAVKVARSLEELVLSIRYGKWKQIGKAVKNRIRKTLGSI